MQFQGPVPSLAIVGILGGNQQMAELSINLNVSIVIYTISCTVIIFQVHIHELLQ